MNKQRRKRVKEALQMINEAKKILKEVYDEEWTNYRNLSKGLQSAGVGDLLEYNVDVLEKAVDDLEEMAIFLKDM